MTNYSLRYIALFYSDLEEHVMYLSDVLHNKEAASQLIDDVENAILNRLPYAESFEPYYSLKDRKYPYYRIYIKNYTIYYVVLPGKDGTKVMEVRRLQHNRQNREDFM